MAKRLTVQDTPVVFGVECAGVVAHPVIVECRKEEDIIPHLGLDGSNGFHLILLARNSGTIGESILWPSSLSNANANVTAPPACTTCSKMVNLLGDKVTSLFSRCIGVEEGVNVCSDVVASGRSAEQWIGEDRILTVDVDDGTAVSACT